MKRISVIAVVLLAANTLTINAEKPSNFNDAKAMAVQQGKFILLEFFRDA